MSTSLITAVAVLAILVLVYSFWLFDCLVRWEYEHHRDQWERDGKPRGIFWRAKECTFWKSDSAMKRLDFAWMFSTPEWIAASPKCRRWLARLRVISIALIACMLSLVLRLLFGK